MSWDPTSHLVCSNFCSALCKQLSLLLCPLAILQGVEPGGPAQGLPSLLPLSDLLLPSLLDPSVFELWKFLPALSPVLSLPSSSRGFCCAGGVHAGSPLFSQRLCWMPCCHLKFIKTPSVPVPGVHPATHTHTPQHKVQNQTLKMSELVMIR